LAASHTPVLAEEAVRWLRVEPGGTYVDATVGLGGHAEEIAKRLTKGRLIGLDRDERALEIARNRLKVYGERVMLVQAGRWNSGRPGRFQFATGYSRARLLLSASGATRYEDGFGDGGDGSGDRQ